jgi:mevalonate kinase
MSTNNTLRANGKLLISGEYLVMNGAVALAFPVRFGQELNISPINDHILNWVSKQDKETWFSAAFNMENLSVIKTSDSGIASSLWRILQAARSFNPEFPLSDKGCNATITADYPLEWGLGSSSTLISLIARWAEVDEYSLFRIISGGSGYDLACATRNAPFFYQLVDEEPTVSFVDVGDGLKKHAIFAFLGNKQNSQQEIERYRKSEVPPQRIIDRVSELAAEFCKANDAGDLIEVMEEHEYLMSSVLKKPILLHERFRNFPGAVKSLGAWGGDFAMFTADKPIDELRIMLKNLGITTAFTWDELKITE